MSLPLEGHLLQVKKHKEEMDQSFVQGKREYHKEKAKREEYKVNKNMTYKPIYGKEFFLEQK